MKYSTADDLPIILKEFLNHIYVVKNKSSLTIDEYALDLKMFLRFLKRQKALVPSSEEFDKIDITDVDIDFLKNVTLMDAYAFLSYCKNASAARARKVTSIRMFYKYLTVQRMFFKENPMLELETPKLKKSQPKYLTLDESLKLLGSVDGKHKERDYCILVLFLNCGLRLSELVSINYNDIRDNNTITITGKGNKQRTIYLNDACMDAIKNYMAVRPNRGFSAHKLRHTAATLMYQHGHVDVLVLKDILGHENLGTTEIYTHIVDEQLRKASEANPLAEVKASKANKNPSKKEE